jgi:hypothetical protein
VSIGILILAVLAFVVLVTARPVSGRVGRKVIGILFLLTLLAAEGLLYYWMRHYTHKKIMNHVEPVLYGMFRFIMIGGGLTGLIFTAALLSK